MESHADLEKAIKAIESAIKRSNKGSGEADEEASRPPSRDFGPGDPQLTIMDDTGGRYPDFPHG